MQERVRNDETVPFGIGCYTVSEAARLLATAPRNISRWLGGYTYRDFRGDAVRTTPLWRTQLPHDDDHLELGFHDLIELRFVLAFLKHGLSLNVVRRCLENARKIIGEERPFSTHRFRTDGKSIFLESLQEVQKTAPTGESSVTDLKTGQMVFRLVVEPTFRDLDLSDGSVVQWRPYKGKRTIVIDPNRSFGKPLAAEFGVPTSVLVTAVKAESSEKRVARLFEVPIAVVHDAVAFEQSLIAA
jgi:uncharacterized protein (DUF433 family)